MKVRKRAYDLQGSLRRLETVPVLGPCKDSRDRRDKLLTHDASAQAMGIGTRVGRHQMALTFCVRESIRKV